MKRPAFFDVWTMWASSILALCLIAPISMNDVTTWVGWACAFVIVYGSRSYQYFKQRR